MTCAISCGTREINLEAGPNHQRSDHGRHDQDGDGDPHALVPHGARWRVREKAKRSHAPAGSAAGKHHSTRSAATTNTTSSAKTQSSPAFRRKPEKIITIAMVTPRSTVNHRLRSVGTASHLCSEYARFPPAPTAPYPRGFTRFRNKQSPIPTKSVAPGHR